MIANATTTSAKLKTNTFLIVGPRSAPRAFVADFTSIRSFKAIAAPFMEKAARDLCQAASFDDCCFQIRRLMVSALAEKRSL
jgi:hypothetical protein